MRKLQSMLMFGTMLLLTAASNPNGCGGGVQTTATILDAAWRAEGNAFVYLYSGSYTHSFQIDMPATEPPDAFGDSALDPYPFPIDTDVAFFRESRVDEVTGGQSIDSFQFRCGTLEDDPGLISKIVFWSGDLWEGTNMTFSCGDGDSADDHVIDGQLDDFEFQSFCVVSENETSLRWDRCLNGPRCDDGWENGNETDSDCGGSSCGDCSVGEHCNVSADCAGSLWCNNGTCVAPTCSDGLRNQGESDVDCGGPCSGCPNGDDCYSDNDCSSDYCNGADVCADEPVPPTCSGAPATSSVQNWVVLVRQPNACANTWEGVRANTYAEAQGCVQGQLTNGWSVLSEVCEYAYTFNAYTGGGGGSGSQWAGSMDDAATCFNNTYGTCNGASCLTNIWWTGQCAP